MNKLRDDVIRERYSLAIERIMLIGNEEEVKEPYRDYFKKVAAFIRDIKEIVDLKENGSFTLLSSKETKKLNMKLYQDIIGDNYKRIC